MKKKDKEYIILILLKWLNKLKQQYEEKKEMSIVEEINYVRDLLERLK